MEIFLEVYFISFFFLYCVRIAVFFFFCYHSFHRFQLVYSFLFSLCQVSVNSFWLHESEVVNWRARVRGGKSRVWSGRAPSPGVKGSLPHHCGSWVWGMKGVKGSSHPLAQYPGGGGIEPAG